MEGDGASPRTSSSVSDSRPLFMTVSLASIPYADALVSEQALFERIRRGDGDAFSELFTSYYQPLCGFTNNFVRSPEVAKELVQDVFSRIWEQRDSLHINTSVRSYLFGAARNHAFSLLKRERLWQTVFRTSVVEHESPGLGEAFVIPDGLLQYQELAEAFEEAVERLPEGQRTVLLLRWHHQLSYNEIADVLGTTRKGVDKQLGRALKTIRRQLTQFR